MNKLKFLLIFLVFFAGACGEAPSSATGTISDSRNQTGKSVSEAGRASVPATTTIPSDSAAAQNISLDEAAQSAQPPVERKIIRNAELSLEAASPDEALQKITAIAESKGGFVVESQQSNSTTQATISDHVTMSLRVPAGKFNEALDEIRKVSARVVMENIKGQDVTEEFIDIEARVKTKKAVEAQYLEIMKQGKTVEDALNVQTELGKIRGEIEQIEGRKRFLESQTSLSTIKLSLQTPTAFSANSSGFFYQASRSFNNGFSFALNFILGFITIIIAIAPFLILVVLPVFLLIRYFWKKRQNRNLAVKLAQQENQRENQEEKS
ncbi:MAG TPA: DUF4349 domain-containing protein [Pyrinomonadaceae bacterium]|jgi:hypothetical protein|nr:DUF4349 domain-containing protein [Pyrinomonadaceae bacterium]